MNTRPTPIRALVRPPLPVGGSFHGATFIAAMAGSKVACFDHPWWRHARGEAAHAKGGHPQDRRRSPGRLGCLARTDAWVGCASGRGPR